MMGCHATVQRANPLLQPVVPWIVPAVRPRFFSSFCWFYFCTLVSFLYPTYKLRPCVLSTLLRYLRNKIRRHNLVENSPLCTILGTVVRTNERANDIYHEHKVKTIRRRPDESNYTPIRVGIPPAESGVADGRSWALRKLATANRCQPYTVVT